MDIAEVEKLVFTRRHRVVLDSAPGSGDGTGAARQFDAVLMCAGFKCSGDLLTVLSNLDPGYVIDLAVRVIPWAKELAGDHVRHNAYFIGFPAVVPDTVEFWAQCLRDAVAVGAQVRGATAFGNRADFFIDLLSLPSYGRYQHTYQELLAAHEELVPALSDRLTILHPGESLQDEAAALYGDLARSMVPLSGPDLEALRGLAEYFADSGGLAYLDEVPVRENKAVLNAVRVRSGMAPVVDTPTDVLRLAAELSGADVTLQDKVRFRSLPRRQRRLLCGALAYSVLGKNQPKLGDVPQYAELWKRLGERLHPHEFTEFPDAQAVFEVARGEREVLTLGGWVEKALAAGSPEVAARSLARMAPGRLWRASDRLLRAAEQRPEGAVADVVELLQETAPSVSGRVLLGVREHLQNRSARSELARIFTNRRGRAYVTPDTRDPISTATLGDVLKVVDTEVLDRLPEVEQLVVDKAMLGAALPLSGKGTPEGLAVYPRGSVLPVEGDRLRFFTYWRQDERRTDYDLSAIFTDREFGQDQHVSWTALTGYGAAHSGDIVDAPGPEGATEFIDVDLRKVAGVIVPQVYIYSGEGFDEVEENFFGFMTRDGDQRGMPFEARTVRAKGAMTGEGAVSMPMAFYRGEDGKWYAKWLHLYLKGHPRGFGAGHIVEDNKLTTKLIARTVMEREYLAVRYLVQAYGEKGTKATIWDGEGDFPVAGPCTYIGASQPEGVPEGSQVFTLQNLSALIPA